MSLDSTQRKKLRGLAHHLNPLVLIGQSGVTESLMKAVDQALLQHELIKVKFNDFKESKKELVQKICEETGANEAGIVGNIAILYRPHPESDKRKIKV